MGGDIISAAVSAAGAAGVGGQAVQFAQPASPTASPAHSAKFSAALDRAGGVGSAALPKPVGELLKALDGINVQARSVADYARTAEASGGQLTPGEIVQLTMRCQEFAFQCQLTSNIANRSSDGVQQLFKQQG